MALDADGPFCQMQSTVACGVQRATYFSPVPAAELLQWMLSDEQVCSALVDVDAH